MDELICVGLKFHLCGTEIYTDHLCGDTDSLAATLYVQKGVKNNLCEESPICVGYFGKIRGQKKFGRKSVKSVYV